MSDPRPRPLTADQLAEYRAKAESFQKGGPQSDEVGVAPMVFALLSEIDRLKRPVGTNAADFIAGWNVRERYGQSAPSKPMPHIPALVKDFHVLYRVAKQFVEREPDARGNVPDSDRDFLEAQIQRLKPLFDECDAARESALLGIEPRAFPHCPECGLGLIRFRAPEGPRLGPEQGWVCPRCDQGRGS